MNLVESLDVTGTVKENFGAPPTGVRDFASDLALAVPKA